MTFRAVLAEDSILRIGLSCQIGLMVEAKQSIVQIKQVGKLKTWVDYVHQLWYAYNLGEGQL